jgi:FAD:protein FMN transferase
MLEIIFRAMGCQMAALIDADSPEASQVLGQVPGWFEEWEQALSRFRPDSELNRLNAMDGEAMPVSPVLWDVVDQAFEAARASGGLVSPTQLAALEAAGYDRSFEALPKDEAISAGCRGVQSQRDASQLNAPAPDVFQSVTRHGQPRSLRLAQGVRLDLGGVAKGWAADETVARLSALGPALMDAGGDIAVSGPRLGATPWTIEVANPFFPDDALESLLLAGGRGVATSGRDYRRWRRNGRWYHHLLDPRTGRPAETDVLTATVVAPTAARAEMAAKTVLILGSEKGLAWLEARTEFAGCLVLDDGRQARTKNLAAYTLVTD